jgi:hypothetical protein
MINRNIALLLSLCVLTPAAAEETWTDVGIYLFGAELEGRSRLDSVSSDVDVPFEDILENLDMGYMGYIEHRRGRWSFFGDINYLKLSADDSSSSNGAVEVDVDVELEQNTVEAFVGYRVLERQHDANDLGLDVYAGARYTMLETSLGSEASALGRTSSRLREDDEDWADTVVGLRLQYGGREGWTSSFRVDVGDGSDSSSEQFMALVGYRTDSDWTFFGGYRYLNLEYDEDGDSGLGIDIDYKGPVFGASLRL